MKRAVCLLVAVVAMAFAAHAQGIEVGATMENFSLQDLKGNTVTLNQVKGKNGTVIMFLSAQCPVVKAYTKRINDIAAAYKEHGINFIGINSNSTESLDWVRSDAEQNFPGMWMLIDKGNKLADKIGATVTPEAYYLNAKNVLLFHGAIDNDRKGDNITEEYLKTAFDQSLAGRKIDRTKVNAFGCTIKRVGAQ